MNFKPLFIAALAVSEIALYSVRHASGFDLQLENNNIVYFENSLYDYNRLRLDAFVDLSPSLPLRASAILDLQSIYDRTISDFDSDLEVYRAILEYQTEKLSIYAGRQRVPLGVGRIWNPIDIFNPIDITSPEPEEREGTDAVRIEYALSSLSGMDITIGEKKGAARIKAFLSDIDLAAVVLADDEKKLSILGWEIEGELFESGIEMRSEGGLFFDSSTNEDHIEYIAGAEYAFTFPLTFLTEYSHSSIGDTDSIAIQLSSQVNNLLSVSFLTLFSVDDHSALYSPNLQYSLSDEMTVTVGLFIATGSPGSLYSSESRLFLNWFVQF